MFQAQLTSVPTKNLELTFSNGLPWSRPFDTLDDKLDMPLNSFSSVGFVSCPSQRTEQAKAV